MAISVANMEKEISMLEARLRRQFEVKSGFGTVEKQQQYLAAIYKQFDYSGSGTLTYDQFDKAMTSMNFILKDKKVLEALYKKWDESGDGNINYSEFSKGLYGPPKPRANTDRTSAPPKIASADVMVNPQVHSTKFAEVEKRLLSDVVDDDKMSLMWKALDFNNNGIVSLAEIDKFVVERYPILNNKPALMRAYRRTCSKADNGDGGDFVLKYEIRNLLRNLVYFNQLFQAFDEMDTGNDRRVNAKEFWSGLKYLGLESLTQAEADMEFKRLDRNSGGQILFSEFCEWYLARKGLPRGGGVKTNSTVPFNRSSKAHGIGL